MLTCIFQHVGFDTLKSQHFWKTQNLHCFTFCYTIVYSKYVLFTVFLSITYTKSSFFTVFLFITNSTSSFFTVLGSPSPVRLCGGCLRRFGDLRKNTPWIFGACILWIRSISGELGGHQGWGHPAPGPSRGNRWAGPAEGIPY